MKQKKITILLFIFYLTFGIGVTAFGYAYFLEYEKVQHFINIMTCLLGIGGMFIFLPLFKFNRNFIKINNILDNSTTYDEILCKIDSDKGIITTLLNNYNKTVYYKEKNFYSEFSVDDYLNFEEVIKASFRNKIINFIPQSLTGIGIVGTFHGIVNGLESSNLLESTTDIGQMNDSVSKFLDGVTISFNSSLFGIGASLLLSFIIKLVYEQINYNINDINKKVSKFILHPKNVDNIFESTLNNFIKNIDEKLNDKIISNINQIVNTNKDLVDTFYKSLKEQDILIGQSNELVTHINNSSDKISKLSHTLNDFFDNLKTQNETNLALIETVEERRMATLDDQEELLNNTESILNTLSQTVGDFNTVQETFKTSSDNIKDINKSFQSNLNLIDKFSDIEQKITSLLDNSSKLNEHNNSTLSILEQSTLGIKNSLEDVKKANTDMCDMLDFVKNSNEQSNNNLLEKSQNLFNNTESILNTLSQTVGDFNTVQETFKTSSDNIKDINKSFQSNLNLIDKFSDIEQKIASLLDNSSKLNEVGVITKENIDNISSLMNDFNSASINISNALETSVTVNKNFENIGNQLQSFEKNINKGVNLYSEKVTYHTNELFKSYDSNIGDAIGRLGSAVEEIATLEVVVNKISDIADKLKDAEEVEVV